MPKGCCLACLINSGDSLLLERLFAILKEAKIQSLTFSPVNFYKTKMADKQSKKASSSRISPDKLSTIKPELLTPSQLVTYDPHQITPTNSPVKSSSSRIVSLGKPIQQSPSFARTLTSDYDPFNKQIVASTLAAPIKTKYAKPSPYL